MCRIARWKNVCSSCEAKKLRRVEHGWCPEALRRGYFGVCVDGVVHRDIIYAGRLERHARRKGLAASPKKYPRVQYYR